MCTSLPLICWLQIRKNQQRSVMNAQENCAGFMQTNYTALGSHFAFLKQRAWQSSVMEILKWLLLMEVIFIPYLWASSRHRFCLLQIFPLSLLIVLINLAGCTGFSTIEFPEKTISAFRSEWLCFLIRPKWLFKSWSKLYQATSHSC